MSSKKTHIVQHQKLFEEKNRRTKNWIMTSLPGSVPEIELQLVDGQGENGNDRKREKTIVEAEVASTKIHSVERSQQGEENDEDIQQNSNSALKDCFNFFNKLSVDFWAIIFALIFFFFLLKDM